MDKFINKPNTKKYKVGIIGCGMIFDRHVQAININSKFFELVALCDTDQKKLDIRSKELGVPGFLDYRKMLKDMSGKMNLVVIATPNFLHYNMAMDAMKSGCSILVEKPVDFSKERIRTLSSYSIKNKIPAYTVLQVRYNPTVAIVKEALAKNYIGDIRSVSLVQRWQRPSQYFDSWRADIMEGGRTLYEVGIHYLDIVQVLFGIPEVISTATFNNKHKHVEFEDTVFSVIKFPNGASGSLEVTIASEPSNLECSLSISGSQGFLKIGGKALDQVEQALFSNSLLTESWNTLVSKYGSSIQPNSYGTHAGSCPNHPTLYKHIAMGDGLRINEAINSVDFIERVYNKEIK